MQRKANYTHVYNSLKNIDGVITDPPYGMAFRSNHRAVKHDHIVGDDFLPLDAIGDSIGRAACYAYVFCRWDNIRDMPKPTSVLVWVKNNWSMGNLKHEHGKIAAKQLGKRAVGIEIDERYCEIAARRLDTTTASLLATPARKTPMRRLV